MWPRNLLAAFAGHFQVEPSKTWALNSATLKLPIWCKGTLWWLTVQDRNVAQSARPLVQDWGEVLAHLISDCVWVLLSEYQGSSKLSCQLQVGNWGLGTCWECSQSGSSSCSHLQQAEEHACPSAGRFFATLFIMIYHSCYIMQNSMTSTFYVQPLLYNLSKVST